MSFVVVGDAVVVEELASEPPKQRQLAEVEVPGMRRRVFGQAAWVGLWWIGR